ncbi:hypothetical protein DEMA109039_02440 [Deinococcus marmoris]
MMPTTKNSAALKAAWLSRWVVAAKRPSASASPYSAISRPSCDTVEKASSALRSVCFSARHDPQNIVATPSGTIIPLHRALLPKISPNLATSTTPALTIVAECRKAETGVGASIAVGSHRWKGSCALLVKAASSVSSSAGINRGEARTASRSSPERVVLPPATDSRATAANRPSPPSALTRNALIAPSRASLRVCHRPIKRKLVTLVISQKANRAIMLSLRTSPSIEPPNSSRYG